MKRQRIKVLMIFLLSQIFFFSCDSSTNPPPEEKPPGYQEDILWPSLADSPWPMYRCDPQNTGRSKYLGPRIGEIKFEMDSIYNESGSISTNNEAIFIGNRFNYKGLFALNESFDIRKIYSFANVLSFGSVPLLTGDSSIIVSNYVNGELLKISMDGQTLWNFSANSPLLTTGMTIDLEGNVYIIDSNSKLHAISKTGVELWNLQIDEANNSGFKLGVSPDGKKLFVTGAQKTLIAIDISSKDIDWMFGDNTIYTDPVIDSHGNIYVSGSFQAENKETAKGRILKLTSSGEVIWDFVINDKSAEVYYSSPVIDKNGNIYFASDSLYSISYDGNLRWKKEINGICQSPLLCDKENIIFVSVKNDYSVKILAFDENGMILFESPILEGDTSIAPSLGNSELHFATYRSDKFYILK